MKKTLSFRNHQRYAHQNYNDVEAYPSYKGCHHRQEINAGKYTEKREQLHTSVCGGGCKLVQPLQKTV
jgi:hypothetical protein